MWDFSIDKQSACRGTTSSSVIYEDHCKKQHVPFMKGRSFSSTDALYKFKILHSESGAVQCLADLLLSSA